MKLRRPFWIAFFMPATFPLLKLFYLYKTDQDEKPFCFLQLFYFKHFRCFVYRDFGLQ